MIHLEICEGDPHTDKISNEIRDNLERQDRDTFSQMVMDAASQIGILQTYKELH